MTRKYRNRFEKKPTCMKRSQSYSIILDLWAITSRIGFAEYGKMLMAQMVIHVSSTVTKWCSICELLTQN